MSEIDKRVQVDTKGTNERFAAPSRQRVDTESNGFQLDDHQVATFSGRKVLVNVEVELRLGGLRQLADEYYDIVTASGETALQNVLSKDEFVRYVEIVLKERVRWIRQTNGKDTRQAKRVGLVPSNTPLPQPIFAAISQVGLLSIPELGQSIIPVIVDDEGKELQNTEEDAAFIQTTQQKIGVFMAELGRFYHVNDAMPSQKEGSFAIVSGIETYPGDAVHVRGLLASVTPHDAAAAAMLNLFVRFRTESALVASLGIHPNVKDLRRAAILKTKREMPRGFAF